MIDPKLFKEYQNQLNETLEKICNKDLDLLYRLLIKKIKTKKKIFVCGNGGSAANANHIEIDLLNIKVPIDINSLNSNIPVITCISNDYGYENIFKKQLESKGRKGDLLILLSGSGNSKNIINVIKAAKKLDISTFGIFGFDGGKAIKLVKQKIHIKSKNMQVCEDIQMIIFHFISQILKKNS